MSGTTCQASAAKATTVEGQPRGERIGRPIHERFPPSAPRGVLSVRRATYNEAISAVVQHDPRAGDFGIEITGSMVAIALLGGLKVFWTAYLKRLEEKAGKKLADLTVDFVKHHFGVEIESSQRATLTRELKQDVQREADRLKIPDVQINPTVQALQAISRSPS